MKTFTEMLEEGNAALNEYVVKGLRENGWVRSDRAFKVFCEAAGLIYTQLGEYHGVCSIGDNE